MVYTTKASISYPFWICRVDAMGALQAILESGGSVMGGGRDVNGLHLTHSHG